MVTETLGSTNMYKTHNMVKVLEVTTQVYQNRLKDIHKT